MPSYNVQKKLWLGASGTWPLEEFIKEYFEEIEVLNSKNKLILTKVDEYPIKTLSDEESRKIIETEYRVYAEKQAKEYENINVKQQADDENIKTHPIDVIKIEEDMESLKNVFSQLEAQIRESNSQKNELEKELKVVSTAINNNQKQNLEKQIKDFDKKISEDIQGLDKKIKEAQQNLDNVNVVLARSPNNLSGQEEVALRNQKTQIENNITELEERKQKLQQNEDATGQQPSNTYIISANEIGSIGDGAASHKKL